MSQNAGNDGEVENRRGRRDIGSSPYVDRYDNSETDPDERSLEERTPIGTEDATKPCPKESV